MNHSDSRVCSDIDSASDKVDEYYQPSRQVIPSIHARPELSDVLDRGAIFVDTTS